MKNGIILNGLSICKTVNQLLISPSLMWVAASFPDSHTPVFTVWKYGSLGMRLHGQYPPVTCSRCTIWIPWHILNTVQHQLCNGYQNSIVCSCCQGKLVIIFSHAVTSPLPGVVFCLCGGRFREYVAFLYTLNGENFKFGEFRWHFLCWVH